MRSIPFERFNAFHQYFDGEGNGMWNVCAQCGGRCEIHKIGTIMPGEKEFMAAGLELSVSDLEAKYLDRLITPHGTVDVLKLKPGCPFLDANYHCTLAERKVKPVLCEIYPVVFEVVQVTNAEGIPTLDVHFDIDELDCPLMHQYYEWGGRKVENPRFAEYRHYFSTVGVERIRALDAPPEFYQIVEQYDSENYDYWALAKLRHVPVNQYDTFTLDEIMSCALGHDL